MNEDYLRQNGYKYNCITRGSEPNDDEDSYETITTWIKQFPLGYRISVRESINFYGGSVVISVDLGTVDPKNLPPVPPGSSNRHVRAPNISFFATGYKDFPALEKKIAEEIFPMLCEWAIPVI